MTNKIFTSFMVVKKVSGNAINSLPCDFLIQLNFSENIAKW